MENRDKEREGRKRQGGRGEGGNGCRKCEGNGGHGCSEEGVREARKANEGIERDRETG